MNNEMIRTENLEKTYGEGPAATYALRGVSLMIPRNSFTCIVGPSGHGKSTLMNLLGGLDRPSSGSVTIGGTDLTRLANSDLARLRAGKIGFVFQFFNLLGHLTAAENVETAMMFGSLPEKEQGDRARELLAQVGLSDKVDALPSQLSGGQQQRVAIARALANDPEILMMDEPTGNLDTAAEAEILDLLMALHKGGKTLVMVTHNNEIAGRAQHLITVRDGLLQ
ncbi:MAG: ABC transporter ATP-binding protein [Desulfobacterales bacterium]|nr:ABC transporter ATP-binding protein [Desulfobacterales bacterium]